MQTASINTLRDRSNKEIEKAEAKLSALQEISFERVQNGEKPRASVERKIVDAREKVVLSWENRKEIEEAASVSRQRVAYGLAEWNANFIRLQQIEAPPGCKLTSEQLREAVWKLIPRSIFKTAQEIFSHPHNYVVPAFTVSSSGQVKFKDQADFTKMSGSACLFSPDRISDRVAENLGLIEFEGEQKRSPKLRFLAKANDETVIQKLKLILDSASPLAKSDLRVFLVNKPDSRVQERYPGITFPTGLHGTILYSREDRSDRVERTAPVLGPLSTTPRELAFFSDILSAVRKTLHARGDYNVEQSTLKVFNFSMQKCARLLGTWRRSSTQEEKQRIEIKVQNVIDEVAEALSKSVHKDKVLARVSVSKVTGVKDSLGRTNPLITAVRLGQARDALIDRVFETFDKQGYNERDRMLMSTCIATQDFILQKFHHELSVSIEDAIENSPLFKADRNGNSSRAEVVRFLEQVVPDRADLKECNARPFSTFAGLLRLSCIDLEAALTSGNKEDAYAAIGKMHDTGKLFAASSLLHSIREDFIMSRKVPVRALVEELNDVREILAEQIFEENLFSDSKGKIGELLERVEAVKSLLEDELSQQSGKNKKGLYASVKKHLSEINPELVAWELVPAKKRNGYTPRS